MTTQTARWEDVLTDQSRLILASATLPAVEIEEPQAAFDAGHLFNFEPRREVTVRKSPISRMMRWWSSRPASMQLAS